MGKKAPAAPDPVATAQAQGTINADTARLQARLNRNDTITPWGSVQNVEVSPDKWESRVNLSPNQQTIANQGEALDIGTGQLTLDMLPQARETLMAPFATDDADARDRATAGIMSRLEPQFQRDREGLEGRLISQGFQPGSEAYNRAADELNRSVTDARMQATTAGLQESRNAAGFSNAQRQQRINELGMLFGLGPGQQSPVANNLAQVGVNAPDTMGMVQNNYNSRVQQAGANNGALAQFGGAALGSIDKWGPMVGKAASAIGPALLSLSDRRAKEDIERVGKLDNGLPVYSYRYKGQPQTQIGLMAQDVEKVNPAAVGTLFGLKAVDYRKATA